MRKGSGRRREEAPVVGFGRHDANKGIDSVGLADGDGGSIGISWVGLGLSWTFHLKGVEVLKMIRKRWLEKNSEQDG